MGVICSSRSQCQAKPVFFYFFYFFFYSELVAVATHPSPQNSRSVRFRADNNDDDRPIATHAHGVMVGHAR